jgi:hypothetical protein
MILMLSRRRARVLDLIYFFQRQPSKYFGAIESRTEGLGESYPNRWKAHNPQSPLISGMLTTRN